METEKNEFIDSFLAMIRSAQTKQEFLTRVHDFDHRFTEENSTHQPAFSQRQKSVQKLPAFSQKPRNPFKQAEDHRQNYAKPNSFLQPNIPQGYPQGSTNLRLPPQTRTDQSFYRPEVNYPQMGRPGSTGYNMPNQNFHVNPREYEDLKEQFYKPSPAGKAFQGANDQMFLANQLALSTEYHGEVPNYPSQKPYNPFSKA